MSLSRDHFYAPIVAYFFCSVYDENKQKTSDATKDENIEEQYSIEGGEKMNNQKRHQTIDREHLVAGAVILTVIILGLVALAMLSDC